MSELRPCPLCGGDELGHGFDCPPMEGNVQCYACHLYIVAETEEAAIAAWNRGPSAAPWPERSRRLEAGMSKRPAETVMERLRRSIRLAPHDGVVLADAAFFADVACEIERLAAENVRLREALDSLFTAAHALNDALIGVQMTAPQWHLDALQVATSQMRGAYVIARAALPEGDDMSEIDRLTAEVSILREALAPFARIVPSNFYGDPESEGYSVVLADWRVSDFTRADLLRARAALSKETT